jgi:predicted DNA-binding protein
MSEGSHGGARPGSGPKPKPEGKMVTTAFVITQEQAAWLKEHSTYFSMSKSEIVRELLAYAIDEANDGPMTQRYRRKHG